MWGEGLYFDTFCVCIEHCFRMLQVVCKANCCERRVWHVGHHFTNLPNVVAQRSELFGHIWRSTDMIIVMYNIIDCNEQVTPFQMTLNQVTLGTLGSFPCQ